MLRLHFYIPWHFDHITMTLQMNNGHIIYYSMDALWSVSWARTRFNHPDHLIIQSWISATYLFPDTISQTGTHV